MTRGWGVWPIVAVCYASATVVRPAIAADYTHTFAYSAEYSDNVRLARTDKQDELSHVLSAGFVVNQDSRELNARVQGRLAYRDYQHNTFADDTSAGLDGTVVWKPLPDAFHWTVQDVYTQVLADPTAADTPANRVNANVFSTGPDIFWRLSAVNTLQLGGRYALSSFDASEDTAAVSSAEADNTRRSGTLRWLYRSSPVTTLSATSSTESVEFDDPAESVFDFRRNETSVGLTNSIARNNITLDFGETRIKRKNLPEIDGASGQFSWVRELGSDATFSLTASRSLSDAAEELLATSGGTTSAPGTTVSSSDIFVSRQVNLLYSRRSAFNTLAFSLFRSERAFERTTTDNEESKGGNIEYTHIVSQAVSALMSVRYVETLFPSFPREDETTTAGLGLQYRLGRTLTGGLAYTRQSRSSTDSGSEYVENRAVLSLVYNRPVSRW